MCYLAATLLAFQRAIKLGDFSPESMGWLLGGGVGFLVLWMVAERLLEALPGRFFCAVCGDRLKNLEVMRNLKPAEPRSYPFRLPDGSRTELAVKALCPRCARRARKYRDTSAPGS